MSEPSSQTHPGKSGHTISHDGMTSRMGLLEGATSMRMHATDRIPTEHSGCRTPLHWAWRTSARLDVLSEHESRHSHTRMTSSGGLQIRSPVQGSAMRLEPSPPRKRSPPDRLDVHRRSFPSGRHNSSRRAFSLLRFPHVFRGTPADGGNPSGSLTGLEGEGQWPTFSLGCRRSLTVSSLNDCDHD